MFGCSHVIAHSLMRRFEQTGIFINVQDQHNVENKLGGN